MTEKFDLFIEQLLSKFDELPNDMPYGFWISPLGKMYSVSYMQHNRVAVNIITKFESYLNNLYESDDNIIKNRGDFLISKGYLRLNTDKYGCYIDCTYYPDSSNVTKRKTPTRIAEQTAKDIATFYNIPVKYI